MYVYIHGGIQASDCISEQLSRLGINLGDQQTSTEGIILGHPLFPKMLSLVHFKLYTNLYMQLYT